MKRKIPEHIRNQFNIVPTPQSQNLYTGFGDGAISSKPTEFTQERYVDATKDILRRMKIDNKSSLEISKGGNKLGQTKRALNKVKQGAKLAVYDIENLGQPKTGMPYGEDPLFAITQVAYGFADSIKEASSPNFKADSFVFSPSADVKKQLTNALDSLQSDYTNYHSLDDRMRGTLADLATFSNKELFGQEAELGGRMFKTLPSQEDSLAVSMSSLTNLDNIDKMRRGLENITNPELVNPREDLVSLVEKVADTGAVSIGHNVESHDQPAMLEEVKRLNPTVKALNYLRQPQVDTLVMSQKHLNKQGAPRTPNHRLDTVYNQITKRQHGTGQAHHAGYDVEMNAAVFGELFGIDAKTTPEGFKKVKPNQSFQVEEGLIFRESSFNKNRGQYDMVTRINPETGKAELQYEGFRRGTGRGSREMRYIGQTGPLDIDGVEHFGVSFYNPEEDTQHSFFRTKRSEIDDLFENHMVEYGTMSKEQKDYYRKDRARRRYAGLFTDKTKSEHDTVTSRLDKTYQIIDEYEKQASKLGIKITDEGLDDESYAKIIDSTLESINEKQDSKYQYGRTRVEDVINIAPRLQEERDFWRRQILNAKGTASPGDSRMVQAQKEGLYIKNIYQSYSEKAGEGQYGYEQMEMMMLKGTDQSEDVIYRNIGSNGRIEGMVRNELTKDFDRAAKGKTTDHFNYLMDTMGDSLDDKERNRLKSRLHKDLKRGKVSPGTIEDISDTLIRNKEMIRKNGYIKNSIPGFNIEKPFTDVVLQSGDGLISRDKTDLEKDISQKASDFVERQIARNTGNPTLGMTSSELLEPLKKADDIKKSLRDGVLESNKALGLSQAKHDIFNQSTARENVQKVLERYQSEGFSVRLDRVEGSDRIKLFASPDSSLDMSGMTFDELEASERVVGQVLPLHNIRGAIDTNVGDISDIQHLRMNRDKNHSIDVNNLSHTNVRIDSTADVLFQEMQYTPRNIRKALERGDTVEEAIASQGSRMYRISTQAGIPSSYRTESPGDLGFQSASAQKNRHLKLDMSEFYEEFAKENDEEIYRRYLQNKESGYSYNIMDAIPRGKRAAFRLEANQAYNNAIGGTTGSYAYPEGLNATQAGKGLMSMLPAQLALPFGAHQSSVREQANKSINYRMLDEEPLIGYMDEQFGTDSLLGELSLDPAKVALQNAVTGEEGINAYEIDTLRIGSEELARATSEVRSELEEERERLFARKGSFTPEDSKRYSEIREYMELIDAGAISNFEDEYLLAEQFGKSIASDQKLTVRLEDYELDANLQDYLKDTVGIDKLTTGRYEIKDGISYDKLQELDVVDSDGVMTVGQMMQDVIYSEEGVQYDEAKRRRIQKGASITGFEVGNEGNVNLLLNNRYEGVENYKTVRMNSGARESAKFIPQGLIDDISHKVGVKGRVQAITANEKLMAGGRRGYGSAFSDIISTSSRNIGRGITELYETGSSGLSELDDYFADGTSGDMRKDYQDYMQNIFIPETNLALGQEHLVFNEGKGHAFEYINPELAGNIDERHSAFNTIYDSAVNKYGMQSTEDFSVMATSYRAHAIEYWQGTDKNAKLGRIELDMLSRVSQGATDETIQSIRDMGVVDGIDYSDFDMKQRVPGESLVMQRLEGLSRTTGSPEEQEAYAQTMLSANRAYQDRLSLDDVRTGGNVIFDLDGEYDFSDESNYLQIGEGDDMHYVINPASVRDLPSGMPSGAEMEGTFANLRSVQLYDESDTDMTVGDLVKSQNSKVYANLINPDSRLAEDSPLDNNLIEVVPLLGDGKRGDVYQSKTELAQSRVMQDAYDLATGAPGGSQESKEWTRYKLRRMEEQMENYFRGTGEFLGGEGAKRYSQISEGNSFAFGLQGRDFTTSKYRVQDIGVNKRQARKLISGREETILKANEVSMEQLLSFGGDLSEQEFSDMSDSDRMNLRRDYILDRMTGAVDEEDPFEVYIGLNRPPTQDEGSIGFASARIDSSMSPNAESGRMDPRFAARFGGDFDGDIGYANTYHYGENTTVEEAIAMQRELQEYTGLGAALSVQANHEKMLEDMKEEGINSIWAMTQEKDFERLTEMYSGTLGNYQSGIQIASDEIMNQGVGSIYNTIVGTRDAIGIQTDAMMAGDPNRESFNEMRSTYQGATEVMSKIQQNAISRKKIEANTILRADGYSGEDLTQAGMQRIYERDEGRDFIGAVARFDERRSNVPGMIEGMTTKNVESVFQELQDLSILEYGEDDGEQMAQDFDSLMGMAQIGEAYRETEVGGFANKAFRFGRSSFNENDYGLIDAIENTPQKVPMTPALLDAAKLQFSDRPEVIESWQEAAGEVMDSMPERIQEVRERQERRENPLISESLASQLISAKSSPGENTLAMSQSNTYNSIKRGAAELVGSRSFQVGAGMAAGWAAVRAIKSGPTPEGNEAEMEQATPQEIAPSQLLSSPTARVAPGAEGVQLDISGQGNMSQEEAAALVNQQIESMTNVNMNMNINVSDNTAKLDNRFYQKKIDRAFGFN